MDAKKIEAKEVVSASKKLSRKDAAALIKAAQEVIVAQGQESPNLSRREAALVHNSRSRSTIVLYSRIRGSP